MFQGHCHSRWRIGWLRRSNKYTLTDDGDSFTFAIWIHLKNSEKSRWKGRDKKSWVILWNIFKFWCKQHIQRVPKRKDAGFFRLATAERDPSFKPGGPVFVFWQGPSTAPLWDCRRWVFWGLIGYLSVIPSLQKWTGKIFQNRILDNITFQIHFFPKKKAIWRWRNDWLKWWFSKQLPQPIQKPTPGLEASLMELLPRRAGTNVGTLGFPGASAAVGWIFFGGKRCWNGEKNSDVRVVIYLGNIPNHNGKPITNQIWEHM